jgi:hypothetical protein
LQRSYLQIRPYSEVLGTHNFGGTLFNPVEDLKRDFGGEGGYIIDDEQVIIVLLYPVLLNSRLSVVTWRQGSKELRSWW